VPEAADETRVRWQGRNRQAIIVPARRNGLQMGEMGGEWVVNGGNGLSTGAPIEAFYVRIVLNPSGARSNNNNSVFTNIHEDTDSDSFVRIQARRQHGPLH
jgi:hypothetical protein